MTPVEELNVNPGGITFSPTPTEAQVYGAVPPLAVIVKVYGDPKVAVGNGLCVVIVSALNELSQLYTTTPKPVVGLPPTFVSSSEDPLAAGPFNVGVACGHHVHPM